MKLKCAEVEQEANQAGKKIKCVYVVADFSVLSTIGEYEKFV